MKYTMWKKALFLLAIMPSCALASDITHWQVLPEKSSIVWMATYGGKPIKGTFPDFTADIAYDRAHLDASKVTAKFTMAKVKSDDKDAQQNLPGADWFAASDFPLAVLEATSFKCSDVVEKTGLDQCNAQGTLTIRGKPVKITFPYNVSFSNNNDAHYAHFFSEFTLKRLDFGIGQGDWASTDTVANEVKVTVQLEAKQVP